MRSGIMGLVCVALAGCSVSGGESEPGELGPELSWSAERGLEVVLGEPVAGAELELGQVLGGPASVRLGAVTIDGTPVTSTREDRATAAGVELVITVELEGPLAAGSVVGHRIELADGSGLVQPAAAWVAVDGAKLARVEW
jgi:hypothetical protein